MKVYEGVDVYVHVFLTFALVWRKYSDSRKVPSTPPPPIRIEQEAG
jgi:hypothetical protein